jgi:hypothetical protein
MKSRTYIFAAAIVIIAGLLLGSLTASAQTPKWKVNIKFTDKAGKKDSTWFGYHPDATGCTDNAKLYSFASDCDTFRVVELPPVPPSGVMDFRWASDDPSGDCIGVGVRYLLHKSPMTAEADTFRLLSLHGSVQTPPYVLRWPSYLSSLCTGATLYDEATSGVGLSFDMLSADSVVITKNFQVLNIIIKGPKAFTNYPVPPTLKFPDNAAKNVDTNVVLTWSSATNANRFGLQISTDPAFASYVVNLKMTDTSFASHLLIGKKYYWRVSGLNESYTSCYSAAFSFSTPPAVPKLLSPTNNKTRVLLTDSLKWSKMDNADSYQVLISSDNFATTLKDTITADTAYHYPWVNCMSYYWKVRSISGTYQSAYAGSFKFSSMPATPGTPTLASPADNATDVDGRPTLSWTGDACTETFNIQVATDTGFIDTVFVRTGVSQLSIQTTQLYGQTNYYWRVKGVSAGGESDFSVRRKFTTKVIAPTAPNLVSPANTATVADLNPILTWNKPYNFPATYRLQVDTNKNFTNPLFNDSTITDTTKQIGPLVNCNQYYWRVNAKNTAGTSSYSSTFSFYTPSLPPETPTLVAPADLFQMQDPQPTLSWSSTDFCSKLFVLVVKLDTNSAAYYRHDTLTALSKQIGPLSGQTDYYWQVASLTTDGQISAFTPWRKFTTATFVPGVPVLVLPANGSTAVGDNITFVWNKPGNKPTEYQLQISLVNTFTSLYFNQTVSDTTITIDTIKHCDQYFWRVNASNGGGTSAYSSIRNFTTRRAAPLAPYLIQPRQNEDSVSFLPLFRWAPADSCVATYKFILSSDIDFNVIVDSVTTTATSRQYSGKNLPLLTRFYWKVTAHNDIGDGVSVVDSFRTTENTPPDSPVQIAPPNGNANTVLNPVVKWKSALRATTYRLQIAIDSFFTTIIYNDSTLTDTSKQVGPLPNSLTYYWRVNAKNERGTSAWSATWSFATLSPPPAPALIQPTNGATFVTPTPNFLWGIPEGAVTYQFEIAKDLSFSTTVVSDSTLSVNSYTPAKLNGRTTYYWHVRGKNQASYGPWSATFKFTTTPTSPADWAIPLAVSETGPARDVVYFGINPQATYGIDPSAPNYEYELPPVSSGEFDARFVDVPSRPGLLGQGVRTDIYRFRDYQQVDTFRLRFQPGIGTYPMKFKWNKAIIQDVTDTTWIQDEFGGNTIKAIMNNVDSVVIGYDNISSLLIIVKHVYPLGVEDPATELPPWIAGAIPEGYQLYQNYPNPFNPTTTISFSTEHRADVRLSVYDVLGREIAVLANGSYSPGLHEFRWNGRSDQDAQMPSGVYYARIIMTGTGSDAASSERVVFTRKMLMLK